MCCAREGGGSRRLLEHVLARFGAAKVHKHEQGRDSIDSAGAQTWSRDGVRLFFVSVDAKPKSLHSSSSY